MHLEGDKLSELDFLYGEAEIEYLKSKDKKLGEVIDKIGHINREIHSDSFSLLLTVFSGNKYQPKLIKL